MLQAIREKVSGWIAVAIIILLIIPFAFWGINYYFEQGGNISVLKINGTKITLQEYQQAYQIMRQQWQRSQNDSLLTTEQEARLKQQTLDGLINRELQNQVNAAIGMYVGDHQVKDTIRNISAFQGANGFDKALYETYVYQTGLSVSSFERQLRDDLISDQTRYGLIETEFLTDRETSRITRLINQTRDIEYTVVSSSEYKEKTVVADEDIRTYYQGNTRDFLVPEQVRIAYVDLSLKKIADDQFFHVSRGMGRSVLLGEWSEFFPAAHEEQSFLARRAHGGGVLSRGIDVDLPEGQRGSDHDR